MNRSFLTGLLSLVFLSSIFAQNPNSALGALNRLPEQYRNGVVWVSADNADPHPDRWYVTARNAAREGLLMNLTLGDGRILSERLAISPRAMLRQINSINLSSLRVNSTDLWNDAQQFSEDRGRRLGSLSLQLQQRGRNAIPIWSVWVYDRGGSYVGYFTVAATTGAILSRR